MSKLFNLKNLSIKRKLTLIIVMISTVALLIACIAFILYDQIQFKNKMVRDIEIVAEIISKNCTAALLFNIKSDAEETISALKAHEHIEAACIYNSNSDEFATYMRSDIKPSRFGKALQTSLIQIGAEKAKLSDMELSLILTDINTHHFIQNHLALFHKVILDDEFIGVVYIQSDLAEMASRMRNYIGTIMIILIFSMFIIYLLTARVQKIVSNPILYLARTARNVTSQKDYSIRAEKKYDDEIGFLIDNFNDMLSKIEYRDKALAEASEELQKQAKQLKRELKERKRAEKMIKESLKEKEILLQEIHHRVKNNLQIISSLLKLQIKNISDESTLTLFQDCHNRIKTMALIHEQLYQSKDFSEIDFEEYIRCLVIHLFNIYRQNSGEVLLDLNVKNVSFDIDTAIPCGLLINELISNSLKYAFPNSSKGIIHISLSSTKNTKTSSNGHPNYTLVVKDNGIGLPSHIHLKTAETLGLKLVDALTRQLQGKITLRRNHGTTFNINF